MTKLVIAKARKKPSRCKSPTGLSEPSLADFEITARRLSTLKSSSKTCCCKSRFCKRAMSQHQDNLPAVIHLGHRKIHPVPWIQLWEDRHHPRNLRGIPHLLVQILWEGGNRLINPSMGEDIRPRVFFELWNSDINQPHQRLVLRIGDINL
jgi:hypothetical protein